MLQYEPTYSRSPNTLNKGLGGRTMIAVKHPDQSTLATSEPFVLNASAARVWDLLECPMTSSALIATVRAEVPTALVDDDQLAQSINSVLEELTDRGAIDRG